MAKKVGLEDINRLAKELLVNKTALGQAGEEIGLVEEQRDAMKAMVCRVVLERYDPEEHGFMDLILAVGNAFEMGFELALHVAKQYRIYEEDE